MEDCDYGSLPALHSTQAKRPDSFAQDSHFYSSPSPLTHPTDSTYTQSANIKRSIYSRINATHTSIQPRKLLPQLLLSHPLMSRARKVDPNETSSLTKVIDLTLYDPDTRSADGRYADVHAFFACFSLIHVIKRIIHHQQIDTSSK
jgi:hypothetical protein